MISGNESGTKWCPECGERKTFAEFFTDRRARDGACAICAVRPAEHVDHDHGTGAVRGVLCFTCNVGLGNFGDDPERLLLAHRYLARHTAGSGTARLRLILGRAS